MSPDTRKAYRSWVDQRHRCYNSNEPSYKYYGAKGIEVRYCAREFIGWWLDELKSFGKGKPTISRIDHDGHYEFGNIKLEDHKANCVDDVLKRHGPPGVKCRKPVLLIDAKTGAVLRRFTSGVEAERATGVKRANILSMCRGKRADGTAYRQTLSGLTFRHGANSA